MVEDDKGITASEEKTAKKSGKNAHANFIAHEVRNSVYNINGNTTALEVCVAQLRAHPDCNASLYSMIEEMQTYLRATALATDDMLNVVNNQLDHAKISAEKMLINAQPLKLNTLLGNLIATFQARAQQKNIALILNLPTVNLWVKSDRAALHSIFSNLLSNAIKFTSNGSIKLDVMAEITAGRLVTCITISDTGIGMSADAQKRLFQAFSQVHDSTQTYGGTGLGLVTAKKFIELLDGQITTKSTLGAGTTFTLNFNFAIPTQQEQLNLNSHRTFSRALSFTERPPLRVLIIDDSTLTLKCTEKLVICLGHQVDTATNGLDALEKYQTNQNYDAIFVDIHLGEMSGLQVTKTIREFESTHSLTPCTIIALSGDAVEFTPEYAVATGLNAYLVKPVNLQQLQLSLASLNQAAHANTDRTVTQVPSHGSSRPLSANGLKCNQHLNSLLLASRSNSRLPSGRLPSEDDICSGDLNL